jgi:hypothetical protein
VGRVICWPYTNPLTQRRVHSEGAPPGSAEPHTRDAFSQPLAFPTEESSSCCKPLRWSSKTAPNVVRCPPARFRLFVGAKSRPPSSPDEPDAPTPHPTVASETMAFVPAVPDAEKSMAPCLQTTAHPTASEPQRSLRKGLDNLSMRAVSLSYTPTCLLSFGQIPQQLISQLQLLATCSTAPLSLMHTAKS